VRNKDIFSSLFWTGIGTSVSYAGFDLGFGSVESPGSGFMFFWLGIIIIGLSLIVFIEGVRVKEEAVGIKGMFSGLQWRKGIYVLITLSLYAYFLGILGFILSATLLLFFLFKIFERQRWYIAMFFAMASSMIAYVLFHVLLRVPLPRGFLGIG